MAEPAAVERAPTWVLRLFIAGTTGHSTTAIRNLRLVCEQHLAGRYELEIIDVYEQPERTRDAQVLAVPTLIRELPPPVRRLVGDLSETDRVLVGLGLPQPGADGGG